MGLRALLVLSGRMGLPRRRGPRSRAAFARGWGGGVPWAFFHSRHLETCSVCRACGETLRLCVALPPSAVECRRHEIRVAQRANAGKMRRKQIKKKMF